MLRSKGTLLTFLALFLVLSCKTTQKEETAIPAFAYQIEQKPKNVVLLIGDGMGLSQISAALYDNNNRLALEKFPVIGFHKSYAFNELITDSAAGATAFACGVKTFNSAVGLNSDTLPCRTILEEADANGLATGLVATSTIVHATPAAFIAHQNLRINYEDIAADFLKTDIDLFIGGGKAYFDRRETDNRNLVNELIKKGYNVYDYFSHELNRIYFDPKQNFVYFTADNSPISAALGRDYLPYAAKQALQFLEKRSDKGFFIMIEGSQIDWRCHDNKAELVLSELRDFNETIQSVLDFAQKRGNTLVIVTGDHETGGMAINPGSRMNKLKIEFTTNGHTAALIPIFAYGPGSHLFFGIYENTDIYKKMRQAFNFDDTSAAVNCR